MYMYVGPLFTLVNDSPRVSDNSLSAEFTISAPLQSVLCEVENSNSILESQDCKSVDI